MKHPIHKAKGHNHWLEKLNDYDLDWNRQVTVSQMAIMCGTTGRTMARHFSNKVTKRQVYRLMGYRVFNGKISQIARRRTNARRPV